MLLTPTRNATSRFVHAFRTISASLILCGLAILPVQIQAAGATLTLGLQSGPAGSTVSVNGSGFSGNDTVVATFNGSPLSFSGGPSFNFGTQSCDTDGTGSFICSFLVPPSATGSQPLSVTDGSNTAPASFTVTVPPPTPSTITVTAVQPRFGSPAGGNTVRVIGSGFTSSTSVVFGSGTAQVLKVDRAGKVLTVVAPSGTGAVHVQALASHSTSDNTTSASLYSYGPLITRISPDVGAATGGNKVTILGHNLFGVTAVTFGSLPAVTSGLVTNRQGTSLRVTAPVVSAGTGAVQVMVSAPTNGPKSAGNSDTSTTASLYNFGIAVTRVSPKFGAGSGGNKVTIFGRGFSGATALTIGARTISLPASGITVSNNAIVIHSMPAQMAGDPAQVDITVSGTGGQSGIVPADQYAYGPVVRSVSPRFGFPGINKKIVISGQNFSGVTSVNFGSVSVPVSAAVKAGQPGIQPKGKSIILSSVPTQTPGVSYVTVTGPAGTSALNTKVTFTFH